MANKSGKSDEPGQADYDDFVERVGNSLDLEAGLQDMLNRAAEKSGKDNDKD